MATFSERLAISDVGTSRFSSGDSEITTLSSCAFQRSRQTTSTHDDDSVGN